MDEQRKAYERVLPSASSRHVVETVPALRVPGIAQRHGLTTGIRWGLPPALRKAIDDAIAAKAWTARVKIGWGPAHVETAGVTPGEAKAGMRPT